MRSISNEDAASRARRGPSPLSAVPWTVLLLGALSLALLFWTRQVSGLRAREFARMDAIMDMQVRAASFHLWLEEYVEERAIEPPTHRVEDVRHDIQRALFLARVLTRGGTTDYGLVVEPLEDASLRARAELLQGMLRRLGAVAEERIANPATSGTGTPIDERFDGLYQEFARQAETLEQLVEEAELRNKFHWRRLTVAVFVVWALIVGAAVAGLFHRQKQRFRAEWELYQAQEALEAVNRDLERRVEEKTESLRAANEVLTRKVDDCNRAEEALFRHQEHLRSLSSQLTLAEERERRRLATELHDRIGTGLAFAKIKLSSVPRYGPDGGSPELRQALELIDQAIEDAHVLTFELSSPILYELGLEPALEWLAEKTRKEHGLEVRFFGCGASRDVPEDVAVLLFQAVRELLANVVKHARASRVRILCGREDGDARIVVEDDGVGFVPPAQGSFDRPPGGFGLFSIRERLGSLGGFVEIEPCEPGTRVTLVVPLAENPAAEKGDGDSSTAGR